MLIQRQATKVATISAIALALLSPCAAQADLYVIEQNGFINNSGTPINLYTWQIQSAGNRGSDPASFLGLQNKPNAFLGNVSIIQNGLVNSDMAGPLLMAAFGEPLNAGTFSTAAMTAPRISANLLNIRLNLNSTATGGTQAAFNLPVMTSQAFQTPSGSNGINPPWSSKQFPFVTFGVLTNGSAGYYKDGTRANNNWVNYAGGNAGNIDYQITNSSLSVSGEAAAQTGSGLPWEPAGGGLYLGSIGGNGGGSYGGSLDGGKGGDVTANLYGLSIQMTATGTPQAPFVGITAASVGGQAGICCVYDENPNLTVNTSASVLPRWSMTWDAYSGYYVKSNIGSRVTRYGQNGAGGSVNVDFEASSIEAKGQNLIGITASSAGGATQIPTNIPGSGNWDTAAVSSGSAWFVNADKDPKELAINYPGSAGDTTVSLSGSSIKLSGNNLIGVFASSAASPFLIPTNVNHFFGAVPTAGSVIIALDSGSKVNIVDSSSSGLSAGLVAVSTGGSAVLPFTQQHNIQNSSSGLPAGFGNGGTVKVTNDGTINVSGNTSIGILGLSSANSGGLRQASSSLGNGGSSVSGAKAGDVSVLNTGGILVQGGNAVGLAAISSGAGGVVHSLQAASPGQAAAFINGGASAPTNSFIFAENGIDGRAAFFTTKAIVGGAPSAHAGNVSVTNSAGATIQAGNWDLSSTIGYGILAQSVGSGGGLTLGGASGLLGSNGNAQGNGGTVSVVNRGSVRSFGDSAIGVLAQSIGGGGGAGANSDSLFVAKGSRGASGGHGGAITLAFENGSSVVTNGDDAIGVLAQSIGGGGGHGGGAKAYGLFLDTAVGGGGGTGGNGGTISLTNSGKTFWTAGQHAHGLVLQSTGGGGGTGGSAIRSQPVYRPVHRYRSAERGGTVVQGAPSGQRGRAPPFSRRS